MSREKARYKSKPKPCRKNMMEIPFSTGNYYGHDTCHFPPKFSSILKARLSSQPIDDSLPKIQTPLENHISQNFDLLECSFPIHLFPLAFLTSGCSYLLFLSSYTVSSPCPSELGQFLPSKKKKSSV